MGKLLGSLTFQTEYFSEKKEGMTLPKCLTISVCHKGFTTPIGGGIPFGIVYLDITHYDLDSGDVESVQAKNMIEATTFFKYLTNLYGYNKQFAEDCEKLITDGANVIRKKMHFLDKGGVYKGLEEFK